MSTLSDEELKLLLDLAYTALPDGECDFGLLESSDNKAILIAMRNTHELGRNSK